MIDPLDGPLEDHRAHGAGRVRAPFSPFDGFDDAGPEDHSLEQGVGGEAVGAVDAGAGRLPAGPQAGHG